MAPVQPAIISLILYCICLKLSPSLFFGIPVIAVFVLIKYLYSKDVPFQLLEDEFKWIQREHRLLRAFSKDVEGVLNSGAKIDIRARQLWKWDSEINPKMTTFLNPTEKGWIESTDQLASPVANFIERFQVYKNRRQSDKWYFLSYHHYVVKNGLFEEMKQIKEEIEAHLKKKKESKVDIYGTLERSRVRIQSLQDRPKITSFKQQDCAAAALISSVIKKPNKNRHSVDGMEKEIQVIQLQLSLLLAFLKELEGLDFQSETEKAWVEEAGEIIDGALRALDRFIHRTERRFLVFTNWMAPRQKLMEDTESIEAGFFELFDRKERYGLKFIRRGASKSATRSQEQKDKQISNRTVVFYVREKKGDWLNQVEKFLTREYLQVKMLCEQAEDMCCLYEAAEAVEGVDDSRDAWMDLMAKTAIKAYNAIEACIQAQADTYIWDSLFGKTTGNKEDGNTTENIEDTYIGASLFGNTTENKEDTYIRDSLQGNTTENFFDYSAKLSEENERMRNVIKVLKRSIELYRIEIREESTSVVGLEKDMHGLISKLTDTDGEPIVFIVGMRGIGKTTLAKKVFDHRAILNHFHTRLWVSLPLKSFDITFSNDDERLFLGALKTLKEQNGGSWIEKLRHFLGKEKNLLVLDNITEDDWDSLNVAFPAITNGSKIMLTTRQRSVASHAEQSSTQHLLQLRTKEESWKLFTQMVHLPPEISPELKNFIKAKVEEKCGGLPLTIFRLGYLLIGKHVTKKNFLSVLKSNYQKPWLEAVANEKLPDQLMKCLAYIILFPWDYEIPARRVVASWVAEEFVQESAEDSPECVAEKCLDELRNRNIIQVLERKLDGKIKTFCLNNTLREDWLQEESSDQRLAGQSDIGASDQRLPGQFVIGDETYYITDGESKDSHVLMREKERNREDRIAFLSFDAREGNKPGEDIRNLLHRDIANGNFGLLKVLDLECVFRPIFPKSIGNLNELKYLGLRWTYLKDIPSSVGNLTNLQTLDVKHTYIRKLPDSIWNLQKLRHLYLNQSYRNNFEQPSGAALKNLQTLWGVFVDNDSPLKNGLNRLTNLRKLKLSFELKSPQQKNSEEWNLQLKGLQSLRIRSIGTMGKPSVLYLKLSGLENLSSLYLFGELKCPSIINQLPQSLTHLTLSASQLPRDPDPMSKLGELPKLRSLCLYSGSYKGTYMACSGFPQLLVLKLWKLDTLKTWDVKENAMQNLRELEIRFCDKLENATGLTYLKALQELKLTNMPEDFYNKIQEEFADAKKNYPDRFIQSPFINIEY